MAMRLARLQEENAGEDNRRENGKQTCNVAIYSGLGLRLCYTCCSSRELPQFCEELAVPAPLPVVIEPGPYVEPQPCVLPLLVGNAASLGFSSVSIAQVRVC
jgi:hypothetical protein